MTDSNASERPSPIEPPAARAPRDPEDPLQAVTALDPDGPPAEIPLEKLDPDALKVIHRLRSYGHQAYLVGGCVRDLLLGRQPKDFDVATSAHPGEIRAVFRNCRLIGRRFRLVHVYFRGGKVVETATFRANPVELLDTEELQGDLLITRDNVFGTAEEDARRRDFTVNGLFYDVVLGRVIDYVGGREDLALRQIRTIGDPDVRFREDPVRILRAVRFSSKLGLSIEPATWVAMQQHAADIARCAPPRVLEEIFRLLRCGAARRCFELLRDAGALAVLLPPISQFLDRAPPDEARALFVGLGLLDEVVNRGPLPDDAVLLSALLVHLSQRELMRQREQHGRPEPAATATAPALEGSSATITPAPSPEGGTTTAAGMPEPATPAPETGTIAAGTPASAAPADAEAAEGAEGAEIEDEPEPVQLPAEPAEGEAPKVPWSASAAATSVDALLAELVRTARLPRRIAERARLLLFAQRVLSGLRRRRGSPAQFARQSYFADALLVFEAYAKATGHGMEQLARWRARYEQAAPEARQRPGAAPEAARPLAPPPGPPAAPALPGAPGIPGETGDGRRRRRRRGGRHRRGHGGEELAAGEAGPEGDGAGGPEADAGNEPAVEAAVSAGVAVETGAPLAAPQARAPEPEREQAVAPQPSRDAGREPGPPPPDLFPF